MKIYNILLECYLLSPMVKLNKNLFLSKNINKLIQMLEKHIIT